MSRTCRANKCGQPDTDEVLLACHYPQSHTPTKGKAPAAQLTPGRSTASAVTPEGNIHHLCSSNEVVVLLPYGGVSVCECVYACVTVESIEIVRPIVEELKTLECDDVVAYDA